MYNNLCLNDVHMVIIVTSQSKTMQLRLQHMYVQIRSVTNTCKHLSIQLIKYQLFTVDMVNCPNVLDPNLHLPKN